MCSAGEVRPSIGAGTGMQCRRRLERGCRGNGRRLSRFVCSRSMIALMLRAALWGEQESDVKENVDVATSRRISRTAL